MLLSERLSQLVAHYGINLTEFSKKLGLNNSVTVSKIINQNRKPSSKTIGRIINAYPDINYDWLINGMGEMLKSTKTNHNEVNQDDLTVTTKQVIDFLKEYYPNSTQESEDRLDRKIDIGKKELIDFMYLGKSDLISFMHKGKTDLKEIIDNSFLLAISSSLTYNLAISKISL